MAIKIKGDTIIDDGRVLVNADKIGIGTTNPQVALEIFSGDVGIGTTNPSASNIEISLESNTNILAVGIVTAKEYYGTFKGNVVPETAADRIEKGNTKAQVVDTGTNGHFLVETENQERLRVNDDGILLIGTDTPRNIGFSNQRGQLQIEGTSVNTSSFSLVNNQNTTQSSIILFGKTRGTSTGAVNTVVDGDTLGKIAFCPADGTDVENNTAQIKVVVNGTVSGNQIPTDITFETSPTNSANRKERLRITSDGNVGIGTSNPDAAVTSSNTSKLAVGIVTANEYYGTFKGTVDPNVAADRIEQGNTKAQVVDTDASGTGGHFLVETGGSETFRITEAGNLLAGGITTSLSGFMFGSSTYGGPIGEMYLYKSAHNVASLRITINGPYVEFKDEDGDVQMGSAGSNLRLSANGEEKVRITSDGKVGIGSTEPRQLLNVGFGTARFEGRGDLIFKGDQLINNRNPAIRLGSANNAANVEVDLLFHADNGEHPRIASRRLIGDGDSARIQFTSNGTYARKAITFWTKSAGNYSADPLERMRITRDGKVGIGTEDPDSNVSGKTDTTLAVAGIVTANEYYGTFKGSIDTGVSITNANKINIQTNADNATRYLTFVSSTSGYKDVLVNTNITYNPNFEGRNIGKLTINGDVGIAGTLTVEDVTNVDSIGIVTAGKGLRVTEGGIKVTAGITTLMDNVGIGTEDPNSNMNGKTGTTLAVAGIVTANEYYGTFKGTIDDSTVNTFSINNNIEDVFSVTSNELSADSAGADKIVFWDNDGGNSGTGELTYLSIGNGLSITDTEITATKSAGKTYTLPLIGTNGGNGVGIVTWTLTDDDSPIATDPVTLKAGSNISISNYSSSEFTIEAVQGAGVGIAASASQVLNVNGGEIGGVDAGTNDKLVYWDSDALSNNGRLDYLTVGTGLEIVSGELKVDSSVVGKSYTLPVTVENGTSGSGGASGIATITLTDDVTPTAGTDPVTIEAGSGIVIESATDGFKISADISGGGGGGIADVQVKQYSDNANPRTVRNATNPIDVQKTVGIVTIGIGTTSNAYGSRFLGPDTPSGAVEGDIWYDTSTTGQGISRVAVVKDQKNFNVDGGTFNKN